MQRVRIGLIGSGFISTLHAEALCALSRGGGGGGRLADAGKAAAFASASIAFRTISRTGASSSITRKWTWSSSALPTTCTAR